VFDCRSLKDLETLFAEGVRNRRHSLQTLNKDSSRSHSLLMVWVKNETAMAERKVKRFGKLTFADLAGSERLKYLKAEGKESGSINKSLFALARVIRQLA
jgi:hypothetical protein